MRVLLVLAVGALGFAAACTSERTPIYAEPTFNKLGEMECTPDPRRPVPRYPQSLTHALDVLDYNDEVVYLPPCCPEGYYLELQPVADTPLTHVVPEELVCVPIPDDGDEEDDDNGRPRIPVTGGAVPIN